MDESSRLPSVSSAMAQAKRVSSSTCSTPAGLIDRGRVMAMASASIALQYAAMGGFADRFSGRAALYAARRRRDPDTLVGWLAAQSPAREGAGDAGWGSGQAARGRAARFGQVSSSDPSAEQRGEAIPHPRVRYRVEPAETASLEPGSVDLVLVAQALHWFDFERFHPQVRRMVRPGGVFAACSCGLCHVAPALDRVFRYLYAALLSAYSPHQSWHVTGVHRERP